MSQVKCPRCESESSDLAPVSLSLRQKYQVVRPDETLPNALCSNCMNEINNFLGQRSNILVSERTKEDAKSRLWRSRVTLLKNARNLMKKKSYGEAIVTYEKYLKLLETVFEVKESVLSPEIFKEKLATKELTVIVSVYWDLLRVYDTNEKYRPRMLTTAQKLVQFAPFTPVTIDIVKKADAHRGKSKNPDVFKNLSRDLMYKKNFCFIATCVFSEKKNYPYIHKLQWFRDHYLMKSTLGQVLIFIYYSISPTLARCIDGTPLVSTVIKWLLQKVLIAFTIIIDMMTAVRR